MDSIVCFVSTYPLDSVYPVDSVIHPLNNWAVKFTKLFSTLITIFHMNKVPCLACLVFKIKSIENSMEGQRSFRGFRSRNGSKLPNLSPERATKEYKYGTSGLRRRRGEPWERFGKKTARASFSSSPNIRKLTFWSAELKLIHFWRSGR